MSTFDMQALVRTIDPQFRQQETLEYNRLVHKAEAFRQAGVTADPLDEERMDQAARMLAASIYVIARDLKLPPADVGVMAGHATGLFIGASSPSDPGSRDRYKAVFGAALDQAGQDKPNSMVTVAEMVESGLRMMRRSRDGA